MSDDKVNLAIAANLGYLQEHLKKVEKEYGALATPNQVDEGSIRHHIMELCRLNSSFDIRPFLDGRPWLEVIRTLDDATMGMAFANFITKGEAPGYTESDLPKVDQYPHQPIPANAEVSRAWSDSKFKPLTFEDVEEWRKKWLEVHPHTALYHKTLRERALNNVTAEGVIKEGDMLKYGPGGRLTPTRDFVQCVGVAIRDAADGRVEYIPAADHEQLAPIGKNLTVPMKPYEPDPPIDVTSLVQLGIRFLDPVETMSFDTPSIIGDSEFPVDVTPRPAYSYICIPRLDQSNDSFANAVIRWNKNRWERYQPNLYDAVWVIDQATLRVFDGNDWITAVEHERSVKELRARIETPHEGAIPAPATDRTTALIEAVMRAPVPLSKQYIAQALDYDSLDVQQDSADPTIFHFSWKQNGLCHYVRSAKSNVKGPTADATWIDEPADAIWIDEHSIDQHTQRAMAEKIRPAHDLAFITKKRFDIPKWKDLLPKGQEMTNPAPNLRLPFEGYVQCTIVKAENYEMKNGKGAVKLTLAVDDEDSNNARLHYYIPCTGRLSNGDSCAARFAGFLRTVHFKLPGDLGHRAVELAKTENLDPSYLKDAKCWLRVEDEEYDGRKVSRVRYWVTNTEYLKRVEAGAHRYGRRDEQSVPPKQHQLALSTYNAQDAKLTQEMQKWWDETVIDVEGRPVEAMPVTVDRIEQHPLDPAHVIANFKLTIAKTESGVDEEQLEQLRKLCEKANEDPHLWIVHDYEVQWKDPLYKLDPDYLEVRRLEPFEPRSDEDLVKRNVDGNVSFMPLAADGIMFKDEPRWRIINHRGIGIRALDPGEILQRNDERAMMDPWLWYGCLIEKGDAAEAREMYRELERVGGGGEPITADRQQQLMKRKWYRTIAKVFLRHYSMLYDAEETLYERMRDLKDARTGVTVFPALTCQDVQRWVHNWQATEDNHYDCFVPITSAFGAPVPDNDICYVRPVDNKNDLNLQDPPRYVSDPYAEARNKREELGINVDNWNFGPHHSDDDGPQIIVDTQHEDGEGI